MPKRPTETDINTNITEYIYLSKQRPELFTNNDMLPICLDINKLKEFQNTTNLPVGIVYKNNWFTVLNDLITPSNGNSYTYMRLIPNNQFAGSVILPIYENKILLLKQFRHGTRTFEYELPRGCAEKNITPEDNAKKELLEETGCTAETIEFLGTTIADTALGTGTVQLFLCIIKNTEMTFEVKEGIVNGTFFTVEQVMELIRENKIRDGFTLATLMKAIALGKIK